MRVILLSALREVELFRLHLWLGRPRHTAHDLDERERWLIRHRPDPDVLAASYRTCIRSKLPHLDEREVELVAAMKANHYADRCLARERRLRALALNDPERFERLVERFNSRTSRQWEDVVWWGA